MSRVGAATKPTDAIVVGAGLAGLVCAYELQRAGHRVTVLEARNRTGGRVYTVRKGFTSGQYAEGGGEFFDPGATFMRLYVKRFGLGIEDLRTQPDSHLPGVVYLDQRRRQAPAVLTGSVVRDVDRFWSRVAALGRPLDVEDPVAAGKGLDGHSAARLLDSLHVRGTARALLEQRLRQRFAVDPDALSLLFLCQAFKRAPGPVRNGTGAFRVHGGNDQLTNALAEPLSDLRLLVPATRIEIHPSGVVVAPRGGSPLSARFCVLAAPLPAISGVDFVGDVPGLLGEMIDLLGYGSATRVMLQYTRRFWRGQGDSGKIVTDLTFQTAWEATSGQAGSSGILTVAPGATDAVTYAREFPTTRNLLAADEIDDVYPGSRKLFGRGEAAAWNEAPSRGAAAVYAPRQVTRYWRTLRRRHGRLLFAGEHTDSFTGSMEGAVRSGRRAAATIQALL